MLFAIAICNIDMWTKSQAINKIRPAKNKDINTHACCKRIWKNEENNSSILQQ
jgi:predicted molibdopterin-dependent oxidoreductase YjgC